MSASVLMWLGRSTWGKVCSSQGSEEAGRAGEGSGPWASLAVRAQNPERGWESPQEGGCGGWMLGTVRGSSEGPVRALGGRLGLLWRQGGVFRAGSKSPAGGSGPGSLRSAGTWLNSFPCCHDSPGSTPHPTPGGAEVTIRAAPALVGSSVSCLVASPAAVPAASQLLRLRRDPAEGTTPVALCPAGNLGSCSQRTGRACPFQGPGCLGEPEWGPSGHSPSSGPCIAL